MMTSASHPCGIGPPCPFVLSVVDTNGRIIGAAKSEKPGCFFVSFRRDVPQRRAAVSQVPAKLVFLSQVEAAEQVACDP